MSTDRPTDALPESSSPGEADRTALAEGLRLALEDPEAARRMLAQLEGAAADGEVGEVGEGGEAPTPDTAATLDPAAVPATSMLLARSAAMSVDQLAEVGPDVVWGWVARLATADITLLGRVVTQMLDEGAPADAGRGFGIAWSGGVRLPMREVDGLFKDFVDLEHTVASVFAGRDLRAARPSEPKTMATMLAGWFGRPDPGARETGAVIEAAGKPAQLGLVALWNAWAAMRYRTSIPQATFELLVKPWITVVGPLPEA